MTKYTRDLKVKKEKHSAVNNCDFFIYHVILKLLMKI